MAESELIVEQDQKLKVRKPLVAGLLSLLVDPGLGFVYLADLKKGLIIDLIFISVYWLIVSSGLLKSFLACLIAVLVLAGGRIACYVMAVLRAKIVGAVALKGYNRGFFYVAYTTVVLLFFQFAAPNWPLKTYSTGEVDSMSPAIEAGEHFVVDLTSYGHSLPNPGDVIAFRYPGDSSLIYVKRCIALPGETLQIKMGRVYVNGQRFMPSLMIKRRSYRYVDSTHIDPHIDPVGGGNEDYYGPVTVPKDSLFVLGDYRDNSLDSRYFGFVATRHVIGKALFVYWSGEISRIGMTIR